MNEFPILLYTTPEGGVKVNAVLKDETLWLTQGAMAELFGVQKAAISKHLKNIFEVVNWLKEWLFTKWKQPLGTVLLKVKRRNT